MRFRSSDTDNTGPGIRFRFLEKHTKENWLCLTKIQQTIAGLAGRAQLPFRSGDTNDTKSAHERLSIRLTGRLTFPGYGSAMAQQSSVPAIRTTPNRLTLLVGVGRNPCGHGLGGDHPAWLRSRDTEGQQGYL